MDLFRMAIANIQPSQLFINKDKLKHISEKYAGCFDKLSPIPIVKLGHEIIYTDGHTRAYAAYKAGVDEISVYWDKDDLDWHSYDICVSWCKKEGILTIADLSDRIVKPDDYKILWIDRCERLHQSVGQKETQICRNF
ncbi:hypothetical protein K9N50_10140 [bacterium]|nr:hypothetical protein [bacterium]